MPIRPSGALAAHRVGNAGTHVAALSDVAGIAETSHELGPGACGSAQIPADLHRFAREPVPGEGGQHEMERLLGAPTVCGRVRQRADRVEQLDHRARPAVGHDQWQRVLVRRRDVDEVDVYAVDLGDELRQLVQPRLDAPEVVLVQPIAGERLRGGELHALRPVVDQLLARPACRGDTPTQIANLLLRKLGPEGPDRRRRLGSGAHEGSPSFSNGPARPEATRRLPAGQERVAGSSRGSSWGRFRRRALTDECADRARGDDVLAGVHHLYSGGRCGRLDRSLAVERGVRLGIKGEPELVESVADVSAYAR